MSLPLIHTLGLWKSPQLFLLSLFPLESTPTITWNPMPTAAASSQHPFCFVFPTEIQMFWIQGFSWWDPMATTDLVKETMRVFFHSMPKDCKNLILRSSKSNNSPMVPSNQLKTVHNTFLICVTITLQNI